MSTNMTSQQVDDVAKRVLLMFGETLAKVESLEKKNKSLEEELDIAITDKQEAEKESGKLQATCDNNSITIQELESSITELEEFNENNSIDCQSGGQLKIQNKGCNMRVGSILDGLKDYLESGKNEQALLDFLN